MKRKYPAKFFFLEAGHVTGGALRMGRLEMGSAALALTMALGTGSAFHVSVCPGRSCLRTRLASFPALHGLRSQMANDDGFVRSAANSGDSPKHEFAVRRGLRQVRRNVFCNWSCRPCTGRLHPARAIVERHADSDHARLRVFPYSIAGDGTVGSEQF